MELFTKLQSKIVQEVEMAKPAPLFTNLQPMIVKLPEEDVKIAPAESLSTEQSMLENK